ncbi:MAG: hypothetical protein EA398_01480 [Deltaproteobacteria bacterium]|nr:MAG: hypothetical protein EA398_01480 [Deltaproteobacteria bacterium]
MTLLYEDPGLRVDHNGVLIRRYYFPLGLARRVQWRDIVAIRDEPLGVFRGQYRIWGMDLRPWWFPLDVARPFKSRCIVIDTGQRICAALTPEDHERTLGSLRAGLSRWGGPEQCAGD